MSSVVVINLTSAVIQEIDTLHNLKLITVLIYNVLSIMSFYYVMLFFPFGLIFNLLSLIVFGTTPLNATKTTRVYYLAIAYGEFGTVLFKDGWYFWVCLGLPYVTGGQNPFGPLNSMGSIENRGPAWMCSLQVFLWYSHEMFSNYTFIIFELERIVAIYLPLHARQIITKRRTIIAVHK